MAERERERGKRYPRERRKKRACRFCVDKITADYKDLDLIESYMTSRGKIMTQRSSGCCAKHQRALAKAIKRARHIGLVPYSAD
jgi:small subunit ribosomal protein S18